MPHFVKYPTRHECFRPERQGGLVAVGGEQPAGVVLGPEGLAVADGVDDEEVAALAGELGAAVVEDTAGLVAGLGGEPDDHGGSGNAALVACGDESAQDVGIGGEMDRRRPLVALLDLRLGDRNGSEVGDRGGLDPERIRERDATVHSAHVNLELLKGELRHVQTTLDEARENISDSWITSKVKASFFYSRNLDAMNISVNTDDGLVSLRGSVLSSAEKRLAVEIARNIRGVRGVDADALRISS